MGQPATAPDPGRHHGRPFSPKVARSRLARPTSSEAALILVTPSRLPDTQHRARTIGGRSASGHRSRKQCSRSQVIRLAHGSQGNLLDDTRLPALGSLTALVERAHRSGWAVAVHCVTRVQAVLAVTALVTAGAFPGDRIEHGALLPAELLPDLHRIGATVVTQPNFVAERGDTYLDEVGAVAVVDLIEVG